MPKKEQSWIQNLERCIFLGYADGVKGYRLWDPTAHKIVISRDVIFIKDQLQRRDDDTAKEKSETVPVYVENNPEDSYSSEAAPEHKEQEPVESEAPEVHRSTRERRPPTWHLEYVTEINIAYYLLTEDREPSTFHETLNSSDVALWMTAMQEEIEALRKNKTWELVPLPHGRKAIGNKWVYKIKRDSNDQVEQYRARLVVKGYAQKEEQLDVKTAFLHGELEEEIYMLHPEGAMCWYKRFDSFIMSLRYNRLSSDHFAYYKREFEMKDLGPANKILGMQIHRDRNNRKIWLSQKNYLKKILRLFNMQDLGSLIFAMICTRSDIAQAMGAVSRYMVNPGGEHWIAVKRILRYIKGTSDLALYYGGSKFTVRGYVDSDFAGDLDKMKSTTEAEYMAATQTCKEAIWIQRLLEELGHKQEKISVYCDSQSALHMARNPVFYSRTKHIGVQYHFVREVVEDGSVDLQKIHTKENLANVMTKPINADKFIWSRSSCGLTET
ncbi:hypothetical protein KPL71_026832 [Citrus sinensis]|uniref:Uncharacterized protein n=1 Tax=Citrus sinensis TaxID=2711 RepID=A0ACB8I246_CITSI|nr:hypothetical protein KPL71_026832 [Citrus sinensis]